MNIITKFLLEIKSQNGSQLQKAYDSLETMRFSKNVRLLIILMKGAILGLRTVCYSWYFNL